MNGNGQDNSTEEYGLSIKNFINGKYSICREERQYALFLYNILRYYRTPGIRKRKGNEAVKDIFQYIFRESELKKNDDTVDQVVVDHVFYEATFMRDFFERNRRLRLGGGDENKLLNAKFSPKSSNYKIQRDKSFNYKLIKYVCKYETKIKNVKQLCSKCEFGKEGVCIERNLGHNEIECTKQYKKIKYYARWMMNATPDIAVIYHYDKKEEQKYLLFLECKFESGESVYSYRDKNNEENDKTQREIQWMVADFLCKKEGYLGKEGIENRMKGNESRLVQFERGNEEDKEDRIILIEKLINAHNAIFKE